MLGKCWLWVLKEHQGVAVILVHTNNKTQPAGNGLIISLMFGLKIQLPDSIMKLLTSKECAHSPPVMQGQMKILLYCMWRDMISDWQEIL